MTRPLVTLVALVTCLLAGFGAPTVHAQQRQAAVLEFTGPRADSARDVVIQYLKEQVSLVPIGDVLEAAGRYGADLSTAEGVHRVSQELLVQFMVRGEVTGSGGDTVVTLTFVDANGEALSTQTAEGGLKGNDAKARIRQAAADGLKESIAKLDGAHTAEAAAKDPARFDEQGEPTDMSIKGRLKTQKMVDTDGDGIPDAENHDGERPIVEIYGGFGGRTRSATANLRSGLTRSYSAGLFPEVSLRFAAHPYGADDNALRGMVIAGEAALGLGVGSQDDFGRQFDTSTFRFNVDAGYGFNLGELLELGGLVGFGYDGFSIEENLVLPSSAYTYIRIGAFGRITIIDSWLYVEPAAGVRIGLGTGDVGEVLGKSASTFGVDFGLTAGGAIKGLDLAYAVGLKYVAYSLSFSGTPSIASEAAKDMSDGALFLTLNLGFQMWGGSF